MKISTRGRYALRVMIDLSEKGGPQYVPLKEIAERQEISKKYLESIVTDLAKAGLVDGQHGKGGGYKLVRSPEDYTVLDVLSAIEGDLAPVSCLEKGAEPCSRAAECRTLQMWKELYEKITSYFSSVTIADLAASPARVDYVI